jgi:N-methylhydantoinase A
MVLAKEKLDEPFARMAGQAGLSETELAEGILSVANTAMEKAIRVISVEKGYDPREFMLFSFGGAGGMHAAFLARLLNMPQVFVPQNPGILSAIGMLMADVIKDYSLTVMKNQENTTEEDLSRSFLPLENQGVRDLREEGVTDDNLILEKYLDMRYEGQSFEIMVPFGDDYIEDFHQYHEKTYGYRNEDKLVEVVNVRLRARGIPDKPRMQRMQESGERPSDAAFLGEKQVIFDNEKANTPIILREKLAPGNRLEGPAVVIEYSSTIVIPPFAKASVDVYGNMIIDVES